MGHVLDWQGLEAAGGVAVDQVAPGSVVSVLDSTWTTIFRPVEGDE